MRIKTKNNGRSEGSICEPFAYLPNSNVYPNSSDMNELDETSKRRGGIDYEKRRGY